MNNNTKLKMLPMDDMFRMMSKQEVEAMAIAPDCPMCKLFGPPKLYCQPVLGGPMLVIKDEVNNEKRTHIKSN